MPGPDRLPVLDSLGVVPHSVGVDDPAAGPSRDGEHPPIDVLGHPGDHPPRRRPEPGGPVRADQIMVGADPARGDQHDRGVQLELAYFGPGAAGAPGGEAGLQDRAAYPVQTTTGPGQLIDPVPEPQFHLA